MQTIRYLPSGIIILSALLLAGTGCGQEGHRKKQKEIQLERRQEQKATSDLNDAVMVTDEAGWDAVAAYQRFGDTIRPHLARNKQILADFNVAMSRANVQSRYSRRMHRLEQRNAALEQRLDGYVIKYKPDWDDFTTLYLYDLQQLDRGIHKLTGNQQRKDKP